MFSSASSVPLPEPVSPHSSCHMPSKRPTHKAARTSSTSRTSPTKAREALKLNSVKCATLDSQAEPNTRSEDNGSPDSPWAYTKNWVLEEGDGAQPRSEYDYYEAEEHPGMEISEGGEVDTMSPGSDEDWGNWMSEKQIRTAYRDLYAVKSALESLANPLQAENLALTSQLLQVNMELQNENLVLTSKLLQTSMELQKMKSFMAVAGEKLLKTGGGTMSLC